jgi:crotonobetainyl-CoA:carnitine CoA-transferase CaiB-like acyl-CoA transferase
MIPSSSNSGPLVGVKVVDFSSFIAGAFTTMLMGDMGAEVTKVESLHGDAARHWGPFLAGESKAFQGWNRNKRSLAVDLRTERGLEIVYKIVADTDVVVENFRPGITEKLKIDYDSLKATSPGLVYCSITAFGSRGPDGRRPGYDPILQSLTGVARSNEQFSGKVGVCSVPIADFGAGFLGWGSVLAALFHKERTGEGQHVETSLMQAAMTTQSHKFVKALNVEEEGAAGIFPYTFLNTKDDSIFIACGTDKFWKILCEAIGAPELAKDPEYNTNPKRVVAAEKLRTIVEDLLAKKTTKEWTDILVSAGMPCAPAQTQEEYFEDPQVEAMDMNAIVDHSKIGPTRLSGVPFHFEKTPGLARSAAPMLGEHSDAILRECDYSDEMIRSLFDDGIVTNES